MGGCVGLRSLILSRKERRFLGCQPYNIYYPKALMIYFNIILPPYGSLPQLPSF